MREFNSARIFCVSTAARLLSLTRKAFLCDRKTLHFPVDTAIEEGGDRRARASLRNNHKHTRKHGAKRPENVQLTFVRSLAHNDPKFTLICLMKYKHLHLARSINNATEGQPFSVGISGTGTHDLLW